MEIPVAMTMRDTCIHKRFGDIATFSRGLTFAKGDVADNSSKRVLRSNNIDLQSHSLNFDDIACLKEEFIIPDEKKLHKGDIFICMSNGSTQHLGKVAYVEEDMDYAFGGFMGAIHPNENMAFPKYAYYACISSEYQHFLASIFNGVNINNLKWSDLANLEIPIPPLDKQERIVAELDLLTGIIDKQKSQLKELDNLAQSIFYVMFGNPLENDKGWNSFSFKDTIRLKSGDGLSEKDFQCGAYPVYGGNGVSGYHNNYNKDGDFIIIGRVGAYCGNVRYVKGQFWLTDNAFQAYFAKESFNYHFMCFLLNTINLHQYANQAAQPVISNVALKDISIICPSLDLQESFAEKIESIESQKVAINQSIAETQKLFDYTMDKYFG